MTADHSNALRAPAAPPPTHAQLDAELDATAAVWHAARTEVDTAHLDYATAVRAHAEAVRADDRAGATWALGRVTACRHRYHETVLAMVHAELTHREAVARYEADRRHAS